MEKNMRKEIKDKISKIEGANLCRLRMERGWTQEQLAEMLKTNVKYLSPIENGRRGIGPGLMLRLCEVFGVDEREFQKGTENLDREVNGENYMIKWHSRGRQFDPDQLHHKIKGLRGFSYPFFVASCPELASYLIFLQRMAMAPRTNSLSDSPVMERQRTISAFSASERRTRATSRLASVFISLLGLPGFRPAPFLSPPLISTRSPRAPSFRRHATLQQPGCDPTRLLATHRFPRR